MLDLADPLVLRQFEHEIVAHVDAGERGAAADIVEQAVADSGDAALQAAAAAATTVTIESWDDIVAVWLDARRVLERRSQHPDVVALDLVNRDAYPDLRVERRIYTNPKGLAIDGTTRDDLDRWYREAEDDPAVFVRGLEALVAVQRARHAAADRAERERGARAATLAGLLIVIRYMDA